MCQKISTDKNDRSVKDLIWLLYESSLLTAGFTLDEPVKFSNRLINLIKLGLDIEDTKPETSDKSTNTTNTTNTTDENETESVVDPELDRELSEEMKDYNTMEQVD